MTQPFPLTPEEMRVASLLEATAQNIQPAPDFQAALEKRLETAFLSRRQPKRPVWKEAGLALGGVAALVALALLLSWIIRNLAPIPPQPAAESTAAPDVTPEPSITSKTTSPPDEKTYDWHGTPLTLKTNLPTGPTTAFVFDYQAEQLASLDNARALAAQLGMNGEIYNVAGEIPASGDYLIVDGNQRLYVRSDQYFQYYPDYPRYVSAINGAQPPANADAVIDEFLKLHGFDFDYQLLPSEMFGGLVAAPLTPDGYPICYEYFKCAGLLFTLDEQGILSVDAALPKYTVVGQYEIISAEEAFQQILAPYDSLNLEMPVGRMEGMHSPSLPIQTWLRARPLDQTLTFYGYLSSIPSAEGGAPLVTLDGYRVTGTTGDIPASFPNTFVAATGQFREQDGMRTFELEAWQTYKGYEDGLLGAISQQGN